MDYDEFSFSTEIDQKNIVLWRKSGRLEPNIETNCVEATVNWKLQLELREYGIKDFYVTFDSVQLEYMFEDERNKSIKEMTKVIDFNDKDCDWKIEKFFAQEDTWMDTLGSLSPIEIEIDHKDKVITVTF